jgi:hypothetical protein
MEWLIVVAVIIVLLWFSVYKSKPENFAKGVAKTQLNGYKKFKDESLPKEELYVKVLSTRPGVHKYYPLSDMQHDASSQYGFVHMVEMLVVREFEGLLRRQPTIEEISIMYEQVEKIIPEDW